jgi:hypothetical protein
MGKMLCICSDEKGSGKTTLACVLTINLLQNIVDKKILVLCANLNKGNLMPLLNVQNECIELGQMVNFMKHWGSTKIASKKFSQYENACFIHTKLTGSVFLENNLSTYLKVVEDLIEQFDIILVDVPANCRNSFSKHIIDKSHVIIKVKSNHKIPQNLQLEENLFLGVECENYGHVDVYVKDMNPQFKNEYNGIIEKAFLGEGYVMENNGRQDGFNIVLPHCNKLMEMRSKNKLSKYHFHNTKYNKSVLNLAQNLNHELGISTGAWENFGFKTSSNKIKADPSKQYIIKSFFKGNKA